MSLLEKFGALVGKRESTDATKLRLQKEAETLRKFFPEIQQALADGLGDKGFKVVISRSAKAQARVDLVGKVIHLPNMEKADWERLMIARGLIDHELGHVRHTKREYAATKEEGKDPIYMHCLQILEDRRSDKLTKQEYPGAGTNLSVMADIVYADSVEKREKAVAEGKMPKELAQFFELLENIYRVGALDQPETMSEDNMFREVYDKYVHLDTKSTTDVKAKAVEMAQDIKKILKTPPPPPGGGGGEGDEGGDDGDKSDDKDKSKKSKKKSKDGKDKDGDGSGGGKDKKDKEKGKSDSQSDDESEKSGEKNEEEADDENDGKGGKGSKGGDDEGDADDENGDGESSGDMDENDGDVDNPQPGDKAAPPKSKKSMQDMPAEGDPLYGDNDDHDTSEGQMTPDEFAKILEEGGHSEDLSKEAMDMLNAGAADIKEEKWVDYTYDDSRDKVITPEARKDMHYVPTLLENLDKVQMQLMNEMVRMFKQEKPLPHRRQKRGAIDAPRVYRVALADDKLFIRKQKQEAYSIAYELLIDLSGSMGGHPVQLACQAAIATGKVLDALNIPFEITGFTTLGWHHPNSSVRRSIPLGHYVFKTFLEKMNWVPLGRMDQLLAGGECMNHNVDGEAVAWAGKRLLDRKEQKKILIVLSDGYPEDGGGSSLLQEHLKEQIKELRKKHVETIGIGICSSAVSRFYKNHIVINRIDELPRALLDKVNETLSKG